MPFATAGDIASASELRDAIGSIGVLDNDISVISVDTAVDCPGLVAQLDPFAIYEIDGYLAYSTGTTPDINFAFGAPPDVTGNWTVHSIAESSTGGVGSLDGRRETAFAATDFSPAGGVASGSLTCQLYGRIRTHRFGGALQLRFCQVTSTASATTVHAGSWLRSAKIVNQAIV